MNSLLDQLTLADIHQDVARNIVSLRQSQDLFDDLSDDPDDWTLAQNVESEVKPPPYHSHTPIIDRPFENAQWYNAIVWPFQHWQFSRFSDGSYGVWYGSKSVKTTVYESAYHWYHGLLSDAGFEHLTVVAERKVYKVTCRAALLDFRKAVMEYPDLLHPSDYTFCQSVGRRIHHEGHPGLITMSARHLTGENIAIFNPAVLSDPRFDCNLTYQLEDGHIIVEKTPGTTWVDLDIAHFSSR